MIRAALYTLGCKLNQVESEGIADAFSREGFVTVSPSREADIYIINTCTVTTKAEQKARRMIRKYAANAGDPVVLVTGCYAQVEPDALQNTASSLFILPLDQKASLVRLPKYLSGKLREGMTLRESVRCFLADSTMEKDISPFDYDPERFSFHSRAFLKIEDGCDNSCTYCRVRIARGPAVSLDTPSVLSRARELELRGYKEIVLTGVNISAYRDGSTGLSELLFELDRTLDQARIRLSSIEPDMVTPALLEAYSLQRIQPHIHLPIQSASNTVIRRIGRDYTYDQLLACIDSIRRVKGDPCIAADMITGLPGETEEDFSMTMKLVKEGDITALHVFPYSPRPGTPLYGAPEAVAEYVRDRRARELREASQENYHSYLSRQHRKVLWGIIEDRSSSGGWNVLTENYIHCRVNPEGNPARGEVVSLRLDTSGDIPWGNIQNER